MKRSERGEKEKERFRYGEWNSRPLVYAGKDKR